MVNLTKLLSYMPQSYQFPSYPQSYQVPSFPQSYQVPSFPQFIQALSLPYSGVCLYGWKGYNDKGMVNFTKLLSYMPQSYQFPSYPQSYQRPSYPQSYQVPSFPHSLQALSLPYPGICLWKGCDN